ncbi:MULTISPECIES: PTS fructose-like transporter subunit IIB [Fusobacterium]|uniref:PTS fructose-like transporter subunit IIB n=1 Tax=Fusobacterium TaxID=848 RepID=UPI0004839FEF|nr:MULTISPECIES: PTS fructose-like transporter subunit IIB [Fusobacterium]MCI6152175.1 PTS fructose-like transporter subunit IIB [Fusobacterium perfoetens]MDY3237934.1 PTS fructose-like transporter subunit IIB [Fusobacterium perfoetens]NME35311.1 PTS fructose-like transporter subunit IIB [Fusobacterium sp. FSA-380-WT-3A]
MKIVAVTSCPSGVAHTYMAAEALKKAAEKAGVEVKVETQGAIGIENVITAEDLANTDYVVLTKEVAIKNEERFTGKKIVRVKIADVVKKSDSIVEKLIAHYNQNK